MANFDKVIDKTLEHEGNYVNDPDDLGGETKYGISKRAYPDVDIKNLTLYDAKGIYKTDYWDKIKGDDIISTEVAGSIFDFAVNVGVSRASKIAQIAVGAHPDGIIGDNTLNNINSVNVAFFIAKYKLEKITYYVSLVENRKTNYKFLLGWIKRALN